MKSQSAIEFLSLISMGMILITIGSYFGYDYILDYMDSINSIKAGNMVDAISSGANLVYAQGVGAESKVYVNIPEGMNIEKSYLSGKTINLNIGLGSDAVGFLPVDGNGLLPLSSGKNVIYLKMAEKGRIDLKLNDSVAYGVLKLYNESSYTVESEEYENDSTVYYTISFEDFEGNPTDSFFDINIYSFGGSSENVGSFSSTSGSYIGSYTLSDVESGNWIFSVHISSENAVLTRVFSVE